MSNGFLTNGSLSKGLGEWLKILALIVVVVTSFVVVREGVISNSQAIEFLSQNKANRELVTVQYEAISTQLTLLQHQLNQLQQQILARR